MNSQTDESSKENQPGSEGRLSRIVESARLGTWDWNIETGELVWSRECLEMFGLPAETKMTYERFLEAIYPADRQRIDEATKSALRTGEEYSTEMRAVWPDGSMHWIASRGQAYFNKAGQAIRMSGAGMDVTQFKKTEEDLRRTRAEVKADADNFAAVVDTIPALTFFSDDRDCRRMRAGRLAREVFGFTEGENVSLSAPAEQRRKFVWLEDGRELTAEELPVQTAAATGREVRDKKLQVRFPDGRSLHLLGNAVPLLNAAGEPRGAVGAFLDITEIQKTEEALKQARAEARAQADNLAGIFDAMPAAAFIAYDRDCKSVTSNRWAYELLRSPYGSNTSLSGPESERPMFKIFENGRELSPEELPLQHAAATGQAVRNKELEIRFEDGSSIYEFGHAVPLFDEAGQVRGAVGAFMDITDRKVIEERLRATTERFQIALRGSPITVFNQDLDLRYRWIYNPVGGHQVAEIIGKQDTDILSPEDAAMTEKIKREVLRTGASYQGEMSVTIGGVRRHYHVTIEAQRDAQWRICGLTCASYELTEHKRGEIERERLSRQRQLALDAAKMGWWHYDPSTHLADWDETFRVILGLTALSGPSEEVFRVLHPEDQADVREKLRATMDPVNPKSYLTEYRVVRPDGTVRWVEGYGAAEFAGESAERKAVSCSGTVRDVTERKAAEEALRASEARYRNLVGNLDREVQERTRELRERNEEVLRTSEELRILSSRLLQVQDEERRRIARDLHDSSGQILTAIGLDLANVAEQVKSDEVRAISPKLAGQVEETQKLVDLLHRELRTTSYLLHPPLLDESGLFSAISWYVQGISQRSGLGIEFDLPKNFGRLSREMELLVFRLVQECLTNIHRHSGSKTARVSISREADAIVLDVQDRGRGIPPEKLASIDAGASGLGIRAMRERLKQFGGELRIGSSDAGTRVWVSVPLQQPSTSGDDSGVERVEAAI